MNLLGRLDKLLALANNAGATDEEARTAAREVCRLIGKHGLRIVEPNGARANPPRQPPRPTPPPPKAEPLKWRKVRASRRVQCCRLNCSRWIEYGEICAYAGKRDGVDFAYHEHCFRGVYEK